MSVPYTFATATTVIPLSQLDTNFATAITLGNTAIQLGNTVSTLNNMTLANVTITGAAISGNVTLDNATVSNATITTATVTNATITTANVTTANVGSLIVNGNQTFIGSSRRILADFSNATVTNRTIFQTSVANSSTGLYAIPSGTGNVASIDLVNSSTPGTAPSLTLRANGSVATEVTSNSNSGGTYLPLRLITQSASGNLTSTLDNKGNLLVGGTDTPSTMQGFSGASGIAINYNNFYPVAEARLELYSYFNSPTGNSSFFISNTNSQTTITSPDNLGFSIASNNSRLYGDSTQFYGGPVMPYQAAPTSKAAAATLTGAELITGILNTTGTTYTITLPTAANINAAITTWNVNASFDWWVINTATGSITIAANSNTTLGNLIVATNVSAHFRIRKTAATPTFTVYRMS